MAMLSESKYGILLYSRTKYINDFAQIKHIFLGRKHGCFPVLKLIYGSGQSTVFGRRRAALPIV